MKLKALSWNIWQGKNLKEVTETIRDINPDIIGLLEVDEGITTNNAETIGRELGYNCVYYRTFEKNRDGQHYLQGNAILTKSNITEKSLSWLNRDIVFDGTSKTEPRAVVIAKTTIGGLSLNICVTHLAHIHNFKESQIQAIQTEELLKNVPSEHSILMGDFNALPNSTVVKNIEEKLVNTDKSCDKATWSVFPEGHKGCKLTGLDYRLDYIFTSKDLKVVDFKVMDSKASDHLPVIATFEV